MVTIGNNWDILLGPVFESPEYKALREFLKAEYRSKTVYPDMSNIFNALVHTPPEKVKAVIIGQDPYHEPNQAHGLCFSVKKGNPPPPSLVNIFKELNTDLGISIPSHGELTAWAEQGVLLLNTVLTVEQGKANSHKNHGWENVTTAVIKEVNKLNQPIVYLLWGRDAKSKMPFITNSQHLVLTAVHPSPLSAYNGFFGCKHFSKANEFLEKNNLTPIDWGL